MTDLAGIELGGTKTIVVRGAGGMIRDRVEFPTTDPLETLDRAAATLGRWNDEAPIAALGIASFGPIRLDRQAADHGCLLKTPKAGWSGAPILATLRARLDVPMQIDTDVNAAALAEYEYGAAKGCSSVVYVTIGTGVGGGVLIEGRPVHGALHPEIGHLRLRRADGDGFAGACPFHGDCVEGLVSGPSLAARFGRPAGDVPEDEAGWAFARHDLGELIAALILAFAPQRIVVGGGVGLGQPHLLAGARVEACNKLAGYIPGLTGGAMDRMVVATPLGRDAGPLGALALSARALELGCRSRVPGIGRSNDL